MKKPHQGSIYGIGAILLFLLAGLFVGGAAAEPSLNSTSRNRTNLPAAPVRERPRLILNDFQLVTANDLGMHCGDLDHRVVSILPPFNVVHAQVILKGATPRILNDTEARVFYSAASNPKDPALQLAPEAPIFKTNFWNTNSRTGNRLAFDAYNPFYPPKVLSNGLLKFDTGLPVPDVERLYLGDGRLVLDQQAMPSVSAINPYESDPYGANVPQEFLRFNTDYPFFVNFPFGYTLRGLKWFAAEGVPIAPTDDLGRFNPYPLMRIQAKDRTGRLTGIRGQILASVDTVLPVSAEAECWRCHTSAVDGGNGQAACQPGFDANCPAEGSPQNRSGVNFPVTTASQDTANVPSVVSREWAADWNILRLHDAKHGTALANAAPVACQSCHYSPALDLAQLGPLGPGDPAANGRAQRTHTTHSRALHFSHSRLDLFRASMPPPDDVRRLDPVTRKPVINTFVLNILNRTCYQCHPGRRTKCLRGAMFNGGLVCQDCHGSMRQVGNDFSASFPTTPFPAGADLTKRIPWASEPGCQSCHTGDVRTTIAKTDPNVIPAKDGIRLLQAYRTNNTSATPISAPASRFAENRVNGKRVLYRLSKDSHAGIFCEGCHGSTHAEAPVAPSSGAIIANDNMPAIQLQGHTGKVTECVVCHTAGTLPVNLGGPHGLHPVNDQRWVNRHEEFLEANPLSTCRACHGSTGQGTVLAKVAAKRTLRAEESTVTLSKGTLVHCGLCHENPLG
jgi:hypothetical protein